MENKKIVICTTFRDFKGTENDGIQRLFLNSLEKQTYQNFVLIVTLFGEKSVKAEIDKYNFSSCFYEENVPKPYRYSHKAVLNNAINHCKSLNEDFIVIWTTCDIFFNDSFFQSIIENCAKNTIGTSHPHIIYSSILDFNNSISPKVISSINQGFDLVYFDRSVIENIKIQNAIRNFQNYDWGLYEHFLISLNELLEECFMPNLFEYSKICKIENNRELTNESKVFFEKSHQLNKIKFDDFLKENQISTRYLNLTYCHLKFNTQFNFIMHYMRFRREIYNYLILILKEKLKDALKPIYLFLKQKK